MTATSTRWITAHEYFLQSDLAEFAVFRTNLDTLTINRADGGGFIAGSLIFQRYQQRFGSTQAYVDELLKQDKFKFNTDDKIRD